MTLQHMHVIPETLEQFLVNIISKFFDMKWRDSGNIK